MYVVDTCGGTPGRGGIGRGVWAASASAGSSQPTSALTVRQYRPGAVRRAVALEGEGACGTKPGSMIAGSVAGVAPAVAYGANRTRRRRSATTAALPSALPGAPPTSACASAC